MAVRFIRDSVDKEVLNLVRVRAIIYNKAIKQYVGVKGRISVPVKDLRELEGKFGTIKEYLESDPKWIKLKDFDDSDYSFESWVKTIIKNWSKVKAILGIARISDTPSFNLVMSKKLERIYYNLREKDVAVSQKNTGRVTQEESQKDVPTIDSDIRSFLFYISRYNDEQVDEILLTFRRDFSPQFLAVVEKLKEKGLGKEEIVKKFSNYLEKQK